MNITRCKSAEVGFLHSSSNGFEILLLHRNKFPAKIFTFCRFANTKIQKKPEGQLWISYTIEYQQRIHWTTFKVTKFSGLEHFFSFMYDFSKHTTKILIMMVFVEKIINSLCYECPLWIVQPYGEKSCCFLQ